MDAIEPDSAHAMDILEFVKIEEIDPVYFDASYYVTPEEGGVHAYHLLANSMRKSGYAGIAKVTMHSREYIVIVRPASRGLTLHTMFYNNEIRDQQSTSDPAAENEQETSLAIQLIQNLAAPFKPEKYYDAYQQGLQKLIEAKTHGLNVTPTAHATIAPVIDLMAALKQSLSKAAPLSPQKRLLQAVPKKEELRRKKKAG
jgi:DNA end-binding protein Ku